jgi:hypothetical protein
MIIHPDQALETGLAVIANRAFLFDEPETVGFQSSDQLTEFHCVPEWR